MIVNELRRPVNGDQVETTTARETLCNRSVNSRRSHKISKCTKRRSSTVEHNLIDSCTIENVSANLSRIIADYVMHGNPRTNIVNVHHKNRQISGWKVRCHGIWRETSKEKRTRSRKIRVNVCCTNPRDWSIDLTMMMMEFAFWSVRFTFRCSRINHFCFS